MAKFEPCDCQQPGCFKCAVGFVITNLGFSPDCHCFIGKGKPCGNRCNRMFRDWASAFDRCVPPYAEWAKRRAANVGLVVQDKIIFSADDPIGIGEHLSDEMEAASNKGFYVSLRQDMEKAATELAAEVDCDPISFDAAKVIVAHEIMKTGRVPSALREWASGVISGAITRPKAKGKLSGATRARDQMIYRLVADVTRAFDFKPTTSDRDRGISACHAVSEAFRLLGLEPKSYQAIVKIWENRNNLKTFDSSED